jgi:hypothetical protein
MSTTTTTASTTTTTTKQSTTAPLETTTIDDDFEWEEPVEMTTLPTTTNGNQPTSIFNIIHYNCSQLFSG